MNTLQRIFFSRSVCQNKKPSELKLIYSFLNKEVDYYKYFRNSHPLTLDQINTKLLYLENSLSQNFHKIIIQQDVLEGLNFFRICEFRRRCMFKLHSIKPQQKKSKDKSIIFGERVKYIYWFNSEVLLSCHVKKIVQKNQDSCLESQKA